VRVFGTPLQGLNARAGYLFQAESLMPWRTARENVMAGLQFRGTAREAARARADEWLRRVGLAAFGDRYPHQLSGGMRKRVSLAQMLVLDPDIILMDEPFSALDVQTRQLMENEVLELWSARRKAVLFITHDLDEAIAMSDRVVVMSAGPASHPIGEFRIDLARPRDVAEVRAHPRFVELHRAIWDVLREEVLAAYRQQLEA
jgi:NitT/TauT family transport system ATP-binding protein